MQVNNDAIYLFFFFSFAGKSYLSETEEVFRLKIYMENRHKIAKHNEKYARGEVPYSMAMNEFGDMVSFFMRKH